MKGFKKLLTGILAATMIMGASITAFASESTTASITITNKDNGNTGDVKEITYTYYQILKADVLSVTNNGVDNAQQGGTAAYYVTDSALAEALTATGLFTTEKSSTENRWNVKAVEGAKGTDIVAKLNTETFKNGLGLKTGTFTNTKNGEVQEAATIDGLEPGYYLILSSLGTTAAVQTLGGNVTINEKNEYPTVEKKDDREFDSMYNNLDPINYTISVAIPNSVAEKDIFVYDVATKGLTLSKDVTAKVGEKVLDLDLKWSEGVAGTKNGRDVFTYSVKIPAATVIANKGQTITLSYTAVINADAVVLQKELNSAYIQYDNYKSAETPDEDVTTLGIDILKVDGKDEVTPLTGAEFTLWNEAGEKIHLVYDETAKAYRVASAEEIEKMTKDGKVESANIVVDAQGKASVIGLDNKVKYLLQEEVAPTGYNKLTSREPITNLTTTSIETAKVINNSGSVLPSTGGVGTTIFYIIGGILIIAGVAYFLVRRKADAE